MKFCRLAAVLWVLLGSLAAGQASGDSPQYIPYSNLKRGTDGVNPVIVELQNETTRPIHCSASLAHWYSEKLGEVEAGATLRFTLWHNPTSGVFNLMNALEDRMPVEAIWCGKPPNPYETRAAIALDFKVGDSPDEISRICAVGDSGRLICKDPGHDAPF